MVICIINFLPCKVGWNLPQALSVCWALSTMGSHGVSSLELFPTLAPRMWMASLSLVIFMRSSSGIRSLGLIFLVVANWSLCSVVPKGMISVFSRLNLAPEAWHHLSSIPCTMSMRSFWLRNRFMLSANRLVIIFSSVPGILIPFISGLFHSSHARGSIARLKRVHDRGSPCRTPHVTWYGELSIPLIATRV